jgi:hypothetical protein
MRPRRVSPLGGPARSPRAPETRPRLPRGSARFLRPTRATWHSPRPCPSARPSRASPARLGVPAGPGRAAYCEARQARRWDGITVPPMQCEAQASISVRRFASAVPRRSTALPTACASAASATSRPEVGHDVRTLFQMTTVTLLSGIRPEKAESRPPGPARRVPIRSSGARPGLLERPPKRCPSRST